MKNPISPTSYELVNQKKNIAGTFYLLLDQSCEFLKNAFLFAYNSSLVQKAIQIVQMTSVLASILYVLNLAALAANYFAAALGGTPGLSMAVQYQLCMAGLWFFPFTAFISVSFLKKVF